MRLYLCPSDINDGPTLALARGPVRPLLRSNPPPCDDLTSLRGAWVHALAYANANPVLPLIPLHRSLPARPPPPSRLPVPIQPSATLRRTAARRTSAPIHPITAPSDPTSFHASKLRNAMFGYDNWKRSMSEERDIEVAVTYFDGLAWKEYAVVRRDKGVTGPLADLAQTAHDKARTTLHILKKWRTL